MSKDKRHYRDKSGFKPVKNKERFDKSKIDKKLEEELDEQFISAEDDYLPDMQE